MDGSDSGPRASLEVCSPHCDVSGPAASGENLYFFLVCAVPTKKPLLPLWAIEMSHWTVHGRVEELQRVRVAKGEYIRHMEHLNNKRQEGLQATIGGLKEEVQNLKNRSVKLEKAVPPVFVYADEQKSEGKKALVMPEPPTFKSSTSPWRPACFTFRVS